MLGASRASRRGCKTLYRSVQRCSKLKRPLTIAVGAAVGASTEHQNVEQHRATTQKATSVTWARDMPRSHSTIQLNSEEGQNALKWLKKGRVEVVATVLANAKEDRTHLLVEILQGTLLARGNKDVLMKHFFDALDTLPDARTATSAPFHGLLDALPTKDSEESVDFIKRLGVLCASKGYGDFVASQISPLVSARTGELEFARWHREVTLSLTKFNGLVIDVDEVFEDTESDYQSVELETTQHLPPSSVLQVIEETLPELLPEPVALDSNPVFEEDNHEYALYRARTLPAKDHRSCDALEALVETGNYNKAFLVLEELGDIGHVSPWIGYLRPAEALLESLDKLNREDAPEVERELLAWLRLLPAHGVNNNNARAVGYFLKKMDKLLVTRLQLSIQAAMILAMKGYAGTVTDGFCRHIFLYASPYIIHSFLTEFEAAIDHYVETHRLQRDVRWITPKIHARGAAIRVLAHQRHFDAAFDLFPDPSNKKNFVSPKVISTLFTCLSRENGSRESVAYVRRLKDYVDHFPQDHPLVVELRAELPLEFWTGAPEMAVKAALRMASPTVSTSPIDDTLAMLRRLATNPSSLPPYPSSLLPLIEQCIEMDRLDALTEIFNLAIRENFAMASNFLTAEMMYYHRRSQPICVIKTFADHFHLVGVPILRVLEFSRSPIEFGRTEQTKRQALPANRIYQPGTVDHKVKFWPAKEQVSLVWNALIDVPQHTDSILDLYRSLCKLCKAKGHDRDPNLKERGIDALIPSEEQNPMSSWCFTPFIRKLANRVNSKKAKGVLSRMIQVGFQPTIVHMTELAGAYARRGNKESALAILRSLERLEDARKASGEVTFDDRITGRRNKTLMGVDPQLYKALFTGFIKAKEWLAAWKIDKRVKKRYGNDTFKDDETYQNAYNIGRASAKNLFLHHRPALPKTTGNTGRSK